MKRSITLLLLLFLALQGNSQGLNAELGFNDEYNQFSQAVACDGAFTYLMIYEGETGTIDWGGIGSSSKLVKIDTLGNIAWNVVMAPGTSQCIHSIQMVPSGDGGLYLIGHTENHCAHPFGGFTSFLQKRDSLGNLVWTKEWIVHDAYASQLTGFTIEGATGSMLLNYTSTGGSWVYTFSPSGVLTDSILITETRIEGFAELSGFAVSGHRNDSLMGFDSGGVLVHNTTFSTPVQGIHSMNDTLYVLTQDSIFSFTGNLQLIQSSAVQGYSSYSTLKVDGQNIRFLNHDSLAITVITLNRQLQVTGILTIPEAIGQIAHIDFNDIHLSVGITFSLTEFYAVRYLDFSMNSAQTAVIERADIGVVDLAATAVAAAPYDQTGNVYTTRLEADVLIKNYGPDTLHSCRITRFNSMSAMINPSVYAQAFNNLNLAPGDSMWLSLGAIHQSTAPFSGTEIARTICIHTNHPNGVIDLNVSNDEFCKEFLFGYVGVEEAKQENTILIYPNPAFSILNFDTKGSSEQITTIELFDLHGRMVAETQPAGFKSTLETAHLPSGIYLARVTTNQQVMVKRVVKQ
jgi:hypothetical protein